MKQEISNKPIILLPGTATARALQVPGVDPEGLLLLSIDGDNDKVFRENIDINDVDNAMLDNVDSSWVRLTRLGENEQAHKLVAQMKASVTLLNNRMRTAVHFGFKYPRTAIRFPFWQTVFQKFELVISNVITARTQSMSPIIYPKETKCR